ncbi:MAG: peroxidase family protein, partial [Rubripirellula sp.]
MNTPSHRRRRSKRKLKLQALESRQLLAADVGDTQNVDLPEDVNADGQISSLDALMVINRISRGSNHNDTRPGFRDVNGDGLISSADALRVINRMSRDRDGGERDGPPREPGDGEPQPPEAVEEVRSIDGTGNNLSDPLLGSAGADLRRLVDSDYEDGISEPSGADRPSAREVSNAVSAQEESILSERRLSDIVWQWGQFIDHDITLTAEAGEEDGESFNVSVPAGDPFFDPQGTGTQEIHLTRSGVAEGTGVDSAAEQINAITAFIDGSMVYGSSEEVAESLRAFEGGRLLTSENDLLPIDQSGFFLAGDVRANEQHGLTAMHTLFVREHNRIADQIAAGDPSLNDEEVFQQARELVIAEIQAITFNEYLPALLGRGSVSDYQGYDPTVDPSISNLFATAAFRYGHTSLSSELLRLDDEGNEIEAGNIALRDAFFNPTDVLELGIDPLLKGLASNISQEIDTQLVDDVRNFLFGPPGAGGFDLAALNIQRGRDHGLPDYNSVREQLGLAPAESFADVTSDPDLQAKLEQVYGTVDDIDVWVGALAEDHVAGGSVGELTRTVLLEQFTSLRDGDRFWYENVLEGRELREVQRTRLSDIIERNTDLTSIQSNAFIVPEAGAERPD